MARVTLPLVPWRTAQRPSALPSGVSKPPRQLRYVILAIMTVSGCGNAPGKLLSARSGQSVTLTGNQGALIIEDKTWDPAVRIDATRASFDRIVLKRVRGVHFEGGTVIGPGGKSYGVELVDVRNISLQNMTITGAHRGIVMGGSQDVAIKQVNLVGLLSDGVDITSSQGVLVENSKCSKFTPTLARLNADGSKEDGDHPDCIQGWTRAGRPATSDIRILNNDIDGSMQGIFFRDPANSGGLARITVEDNRVRVGRSNAIFLEGVRDAVVRRNQVSSLPGAVQLRTGRPVKANIILKTTAGTICANAVADLPTHPSSRPC